jgi:regulator of cell morphogenesis and NO signaling
MAAIAPERTLAELVAEQPGRARVFDELGLDYCCGGRRSLAETATDRGLEAETLVAALEAADRAADGAGHDLSGASLGAVCGHIVDVHHAYLRDELPRIEVLASKVANRHGDSMPALVELDSRFAALHRDLIDHIDREEGGIFVLCQELDAGAASNEDPVPQLWMHEAAHDGVGQALTAIRELTDGFDARRARCTTHRVLLDSLRELEADIHLHIHEENNILFPRLRQRLAETTA